MSNALPVWLKRSLLPAAYAASWLYRWGASVQRWMHTALLRPTRLSANVIVVGNLTTGGTGKTPVVMDLAKRLQEQGKKVAILSRGYKAKKLRPPVRITPEHTSEGVGDEPFLMARTLPQIPIWIDPKRVRSGKQAAVHADTLLLDDGFQHHALCSDHRLVLINARNPFGNGHCLPLGPLREPASGLKRATEIIFTHCPEAPPKALIKSLRRHNPTAPIHRCYPQASSLLSWPDRREHALDSLKGQRLGLFCAIANPERFEALAQSTLRCSVAFFKTFRDHHRFCPQDLQALQRQALLTGVHALLTTEKDAVRLPAPPLSLSLPIWILPLHLIWPDSLPLGLKQQERPREKIGKAI